IPTSDSVALMANYDKLTAHVREDLQRINGEFPVEAVLASLMGSCSRASGKALLAQEAQVMRAANDIRTLAHDAAPDENIPLLAYVNAAGKSADGRRKITLKSIPTGLADAAENALQQAAVI